MKNKIIILLVLTIFSSTNFPAAAGSQEEMKAESTNNATQEEMLLAVRRWMADQAKQLPAKERYIYGPGMAKPLARVMTEMAQGWKVPGGSKLIDLGPNLDNITEIIESSDGKFLGANAIYEDEGFDVFFMYVFDTQNWQRAFEAENASLLDISEDGKFVAIQRIDVSMPVYQDSVKVEVLRTSDWSVVHTFEKSDTADFSKNDDYIFVKQATDQELSTWNMYSMKDKSLIKSFENVAMILAGNDYISVATQNQGNRAVELYSLDDLKPVKLFPDSRTPDFSFDKKLLLMRTMKNKLNSVLVYDVSNHKIVKEIENGLVGCSSNDGDMVAVQFKKGKKDSVVLYNTRDWSQIATYNGYLLQHFAPGCPFLRLSKKIPGQKQLETVIIDLETMKELKPLPYANAISPDCSYIAYPEGTKIRIESLRALPREK